MVHGNIAAQTSNHAATQGLLRRIEDGADAHVGSGCLRDDIAHEANQNDRKDENRQILVESGEFAEAHRAGNHETAAERQDNDCRGVGGERDGGDQARKQTQNTQADVAGLGVGFDELLIFNVLGIEKADERRAEDAFVDDAVQPVYGFLAALEKGSDLAKHQLKRDGDERNDSQNGESEPPVDGEQTGCWRRR